MAEYESDEAAATALKLSGTEILGVPLLIATTPPHPGAEAHGAPPSGSRADGGAAEGLPGVAGQGDAAHRTAYIGNIHPQLTSYQVAQFFSVCGPIKQVRIAGDDRMAHRYAFVEFVNPASVSTALQLNSTPLFGLYLRISAAKSAIVNATLTLEPAPPSMLVASNLGGVHAGAADDGEGGASPDGHSRSSSPRSRSRRRRSRSRSRDGKSRSRSRSGSRSRSRERAQT